MEQRNHSLIEFSMPQKWGISHTLKNRGNHTPCLPIVDYNQSIPILFLSSCQHPLSRNHLNKLKSGEFKHHGSTIRSVLFLNFFREYSCVRSRLLIMIKSIWKEMWNCQIQLWLIRKPWRKKLVHISSYPHVNVNFQRFSTFKLNIVY